MSLVKSIGDFGKVKANPDQVENNAFTFPECASQGIPACEDRIEIPAGTQVTGVTFAGDFFALDPLKPLEPALQNAVKKYEFDTFIRVKDNVIRHIGKLELNSITVKVTEAGAPIRTNYDNAPQARAIGADLVIEAKRLCTLTKTCMVKYTVMEGDSKAFTYTKPDGSTTNGTVDNAAVIEALEGVTSVSIEPVTSPAGDYEIVSVEAISGYKITIGESAPKHCGCREIFV